MMRRMKSQVRAGYRGCYCCYPPASRKVQRAREKRMWKKESNV